MRLVHDLRAPLTVVGGFAELLVARGDALAPEQRAEYATRIDEGARQLRAILDAAGSAQKPSGPSA